MSSTGNTPASDRSSKAGRPPASRRIRVVADPRPDIDPFKLARALLRLAQDEYDIAHDPPRPPESDEVHHENPR